MPCAVTDARAASISSSSPRPRDSEIGLAYALAAYLWWGLIPLYFKLVAHVPAMIVLAHRVIWSFALLALLIALWRQARELTATMRDGRVLVRLCFSTALLATNWGTFIFAVATNRVLQASLGYFIVPLLSVALGVGVLRERLRRLQLLAIVIAIAGVVVVTFARGDLPVIALTVAFSWSGYSLARKVTPVGPLVGVTIECALLLPPAALYLAFHPATGLGLDRHTFLLLTLAGFVTALPLLWFTAATRRLRLSTVGFLQYVVPTGQFLLAVLAFKEPFGRANLLGFAFIWIALAIYSLDSLRACRIPAAESVAEIV